MADESGIESYHFKQRMEEKAREAKEAGRRATKQKKIGRIRAREIAEYEALKTRDVPFKKPPRP